MASGITDIPTLVVIADDPNHIGIFIDASRNATNERCNFECVKTLAQGIKRLKRSQARAVFINLSLFDRQPLETVDRVSRVAPNTPILVMVGTGEPENALAVLQLGPGSYLVPFHHDRDSLVWAIREMVERTSADEALFTEKTRVQITPDFIGDTTMNTTIQCRITLIGIGARASVLAITVLDSEFKIREVLVCRKARPSTFLQE